MSSESGWIQEAFVPKPQPTPHESAILLCRSTGPTLRELRTPSTAFRLYKTPEISFVLWQPIIASQSPTVSGNQPYPLHRPLLLPECVRQPTLSAPSTSSPPGPWWWWPSAQCMGSSACTIPALHSRRCLMKTTFLRGSGVSFRTQFWHQHQLI